MQNTRKTYTVSRLLCALVAIVSIQWATGQTEINTHRLIGTRLDNYDTDGAAAGWTFQDSTRYTYTGFNTAFTLHSPHLFYEGLEGRVAVIEPLLPWVYYGLFPPLSNSIVSLSDRMQFDSLFSYSYEEDASNWNLEGITTRCYALNQITCDILMDWYVPGIPDTSQKLIEYDPMGRVTKYTVLEYINDEDEMDTISEYTFAYADDKLVQYTQYVWVLDQRYTGVITDYTYNAQSLVFEELKTYYTLDEVNLPYQHNKYQIVYNDQGLVVAINRLLKFEEDWHMSEQKLFDFNDNQLLRYTYLWRTVDTIPTLELSVWDTLILKEYYWTDIQLDSILTQQNTSGHNYNLHDVMREEMDYTESRLTHYVTKYINDVVPATHDYSFEYNEKGQVVHKSYRSEYPLSPYFIAMDSFYIYDAFDNIIKTELHYGTSYFSPDDIPQEPLRRKYYYYEAQPIAGSTDGPLAIHAFPNPTKEILNIYFFLSDNTSGEADIHVYAMDGKEVNHMEQFVVHNSYVTLDCSRLLSGVYFISATVNGYRAYQSFMVR